MSKNQQEFVLYFILRSNVCSTFEWVYVLTVINSKTTVCSQPSDKTNANHFVKKLTSEQNIYGLVLSDNFIVFQTVKGSISNT